MMLLMTVVISSLLLMSYYYKLQVIENITNKKLHRNFNSTLALVCSDSSLWSDGKRHIDIFKDEQDFATITSDYWGVYKKLIIENHIGTDTLKKVLMIGNKYIPVAIYLADKNEALTLSGNTKINGTCFLPEKSVKRGYAENKHFSGDRLINGKVYKSSKQVKGFDFEGCNRAILNLQNKAYPPNELLGDTIINSFHNSEFLYFSEELIDLRNKTLIGNIIVRSEHSIIVDSTSTLNDIILIAPSIHFKEKFIGSIQAFAIDSIVVENDVYIRYPSALVLIDQRLESNIKKTLLTVSGESIIEGMIIALGNNRSEMTFLKGCRVDGVIVSNSTVDFQAHLNGSIYSYAIDLTLKSGIYRSHLLDAVINANALHSDYTVSDFLSANKSKLKRQIIKWLK